MASTCAPAGLSIEGPGASTQPCIHSSHQAWGVLYPPGSGGLSFRVDAPRRGRVCAETVRGAGATTGGSSGLLLKPQDADIIVRKGLFCFIKDLIPLAFPCLCMTARFFFLSYCILQNWLHIFLIQKIYRARAPIIINQAEHTNTRNEK